MWMLYASYTGKSGCRGHALLLADHAGTVQQAQRCSTPGLIACTQERQICGPGMGASKHCRHACGGWELPTAVFAHAMACNQTSLALAF